jgi:hypothetical protein
LGSILVLSMLATSIISSAELNTNLNSNFEVVRGNATVNGSEIRVNGYTVISSSLDSQPYDKLQIEMELLSRNVTGYFFIVFGSKYTNYKEISEGYNRIEVKFDPQYQNKLARIELQLLGDGSIEVQNLKIVKTSPDFKSELRNYTIAIYRNGPFSTDDLIELEFYVNPKKKMNSVEYNIYLSYFGFNIYKKSKGYLFLAGLQPGKDKRFVEKADLGLIPLPGIYNLRVKSDDGWVYEDSFTVLPGIGNLVVVIFIVSIIFAIKNREKLQKLRDIEISKSEKLTVKDYLFITLLSIIGGVVIWYKFKELGNIAILLSILTGLLVFTLSVTLIEEEVIEDDID